MRKLLFLFGFAVGFMAGSRAGTVPYEQLESNVRRVAKRPAGKSASEEIVEIAKEQTDELIGAAQAGRARTNNR